MGRYQGDLSAIALPGSRSVCSECQRRLVPIKYHKTPRPGLEQSPVLGQNFLGLGDMADQGVHDDHIEVASRAQGPAAQEHRLRILLVVAVGSNAAAAASDSVCPSPRGLGAQGPADGSDPRQPERQSGTKRGAPIDPQGYDAGKKVTGRKRHILVDTLGLLLNVVVHRASVQDRDGTRRLLRDAAHRFPSITKIFADAGYQGPKTSSSSCPSAGSWSVPSLDQREEKMTNYPY